MTKASGVAALTALWVATGMPAAGQADTPGELDLCKTVVIAADKIDHCSKVISQSKNRIFLEIAYNTRGLAYLRTGRFAEAIADFSEVIHLDPKIAGYFDNRQNAYRSANRLPEALADANTAIGLAPTYSFVYRSRATVYRDMADWQDAISDYTQAIRIDPSDGSLFIDRGKILIRMNRVADAISNFSHALDLDQKKWNWAFRERGLAYKLIGQLDSAKSDLSAWVNLQPDDSEAVQALSELQKPTPVSDGNLTVPARTAPDEKRVALVIGNADYRGASLANPTIDADLVSDSLRKVGFDVTEAKNLDFARFDDVLTQFVSKEKGADIALFYFAGHGFAISGDDRRARNYLMSTSADMNAKSDALLRRDGITIDDVITRISAPVRITLAFVDACRNDPFHRGAGDRGFAPIQLGSSQQVYIGMSTQLDKPAVDGDVGQGSPFAHAFAAKMTTPGLRIDDAFRSVRSEVIRLTDSRQQPEVLLDNLAEGAIVLVPSHNPPNGEPLLPVTTKVPDERDNEALRRQQETERLERLAQAPELCDQLAGNPYDRMRPAETGSATFAMLKTSATGAIEACQVAVQKSPTEPRYRYQLARAYQVGDPEKALPLLKQLVMERYPAAFDNYGWTFLDNRVGLQDLQSSIDAFRAGSTLGDVSSMYSLADLILDGKTPPRSPNEAETLLQQAAAQGHLGAQQRLAELQEQYKTTQQKQIQEEKTKQMVIGIFGTFLQGMQHH
jgi:uncharacterized caspase-like protein/Flp pilus assembly protein TadD